MNTGRLVRFFRENHKAMDLPDDFGAESIGGNHVYTWSVSKSGEDVLRIVQMTIYPDESVIRITASISPKDFKKKHRENTKLIGIAKFNDLAKTRIWIENHLRRASKFARYNLLFNIDFADAMPGTYRNIL